MFNVSFSKDKKITSFSDHQKFSYNTISLWKIDKEINRDKKIDREIERERGGEIEKEIKERLQKFKSHKKN